MDWVSIIVAGLCIGFFAWVFYRALQEPADRLWELIKRGLSKLADGFQDMKATPSEVLVYE